MKELFKKWLEKRAIIAKTSYTDCNRYLFVVSLKGNEYRPGWNLG